MVSARAILLCLGCAAAQDRGEQGECIGSRFHTVTYDMSEERDSNGYPRDFSVQVTPHPEQDDKCPPPNAGGTEKGVCVGVNTNDCHTARGALTINDFLSCEKCFAGLATDITYDLEVSNFQLQKVSLGVQNAHLLGAAELLAHQAASTTVASGSFPLIGEDKSYDINFLVGGVIPVNINFKLPTELTYSVTLSDSVNLHFGGDVDLNLGNHEIAWTKDGGWNTPSTDASVAWTPVLSADGKVSADVPLALKSTLKVEFEKVLSYDLSLSPSMPLHAEASLDSNGGNQICVNSDADIKLDHEAKLHFEIFGHDTTFADFGPATLYQHHFDKVFNKCWSIGQDEVIV